MTKHEDGKKECSAYLSELFAVDLQHLGVLKSKWSVEVCFFL